MVEGLDVVLVGCVVVVDGDDERGTEVLVLEASAVSAGRPIGYTSF